MSVKGCYTDFHIDFGGTSVWYHVFKGRKVSSVPHCLAYSMRLLNNKSVLLLRCFGWCLRPRITSPFMRTGSFRASRATSSWEIEPTAAREWSFSRDTPSSSHLVCWHGRLKVASRKRLAATPPASNAKPFPGYCTNKRSCASLREFLSHPPVSPLCFFFVVIKGGSTPSILPRTRWCSEATFCTALTFLCSLPSMR